MFFDVVRQDLVVVIAELFPIGAIEVFVKARLQIDHFNGTTCAVLTFHVSTSLALLIVIGREDTVCNRNVVFTAHASNFGRRCVGHDFEVTAKGSDIYKPSALHDFSMYLDGQWYELRAKPGTYDDHDPIGVLDVTILSNLVLDKILGIHDLRTDKRIDFVGGIRGLGELQQRVDSGEMAVAFALYPVSMKQLIDIADTGNIMPPKTTWFEPKLRSGLVIHSLDD